jgi:YidC/Oxa1 family membrane protein insertase
MEEKKFDINSLIGFVLLGAIILWWMYSNQPTPEELEAEKKQDRKRRTNNRYSNTYRYNQKFGNNYPSNRFTFFG